VKLARGGLAPLTVAAGLALASCGGGSSTQARPPHLGDQSLATGDRTVAALAMGQLGNKNETFWQLVTSRAGSPWTLVTPPGIATNGGIVFALPTTGVVVAALLPSQLLGFTALARSGDGGRTWSPGVVPGALDTVPDAIGAGAGLQLVALRSGRAGDVVASRTLLSEWTTLATKASISRSIGGCTLTSLTGVAVGPSGAVLASGSCASRSTPIVELLDGRWRSVGPTTLTLESMDVVRLVGTARGAVALVEEHHSAHHELVVLASTDRFASWRSSQLVLGRGVVTSTSVTASGAASVLVTEPGGSTEAFTTHGAGLAWSQLPTPPARVAVVTADDTGPIQALAVDRSVLTVYVERDGHWVVDQRLVVPIEYGSSG
jgi:hypothetical protein